MALAAHDDAILYSLEPWAPRTTGPDGFHGYKVLGSTKLSSTDAARAVVEFRSVVVTHWTGPVAACFDPRHALHVEYVSHTYDFLLCYRCQALEIYKDGTLIADVHATGNPAVLNTLLTAAGLRVATSDDPEEDRKRAVQDELDRQRWITAAPPSIRPLLSDSVLEASRPEPAFMAAAKAAIRHSSPHATEQLQALLEWFGSGTGRWSGFPAYEEYVGTIISDYADAEIATAIQSGQLDGRQLDGAARLIADDWWFRDRSQHLIGLLSPEVKQRLIQRMLGSGDPNREALAKKAFGL